MLVDTHCALELSTATKQITEREMQLGGVRVALHGFDESVDGLVLLLVEQMVQAFEIGFGVAAVFHAQLAQIKARSQPAQDECQGEAEKNQVDIKVHTCPRLQGAKPVCRQQVSGLAVLF